MNFTSDNATGACDSVMQAVLNANTGAANAYGADDWTEALTARLRDVFEKDDLVVYPVATGTAANALSLATLVPPFGSIFCHRDAHINCDECGAPEMYTGGAKLILVDGEHGKITPDALDDAIDQSTKRGVHQVRPGAISLTQATESGTIYSLAEIDQLSAVAGKYKIPVHMDGARFANALVTLGCSPAEMTWRRGVDILSFGATKNGAMAAEAVILFDPAKALEFEYRRKRAGHLFSKMRFLSAQLLGYLEEDAWLANARHANQMATRLAEGLMACDGVSLRAPVEANEVFPILPADMNTRLRDAGALFHDWVEGGPGCTRFVTAFNTAKADVDALLKAAKP